MPSSPSHLLPLTQSSSQQKNKRATQYIQGYKFNIFYNDLVDQRTSPTFEVIRDHSNPGTAILRFSAGPPYADIAFRILDKSWEREKRRGYKCNFDRGVLQVWFYFKRR